MYVFVVCVCVRACAFWCVYVIICVYSYIFASSQGFYELEHLK